MPWRIRPLQRNSVGNWAVHVCLEQERCPPVWPDKQLIGAEQSNFARRRYLQRASAGRFLRRDQDRNTDHEHKLQRFTAEQPLKLPRDHSEFQHDPEWDGPLHISMAQKRREYFWRHE